MDNLQRTLLNRDPRSQVLACLYHSATGVRVGVKSTDRNGKFKMDVSSVTSGIYELRYYGDGIQPTVKDGNGDVVSEDPITPWEYEIEIISISGSEPITFSASPALAVSEGSTGEDIPDVDFNRAETSLVVLSLTSLSTTAGLISEVMIYFKRNSQTNYKVFHTFDFDPALEEVQSDLSAAVFKKIISLFDKPSSFDFKAVFMNPNGEVALTGGVAVVATDLNVTFNGISDLSEYVEVLDLECTNASTPEGSPSGVILQSSQVTLEWTDLKEMVRASFPFSSNDALGDAVEVTYQQSRKISSYVVYMFISDDVQVPEHEYPDTSDTNGTWYFMVETDKPFANFHVPKNKFIAFWVGFRTELTATSVPKTTFEY